jgi:hypothetical protein
MSFDEARQAGWEIKRREAKHVYAIIVRKARNGGEIVVAMCL